MPSFVNCINARTATGLGANRPFRHYFDKRWISAKFQFHVYYKKNNHSDGEEKCSCDEMRGQGYHLKNNIL